MIQRILSHIADDESKFLFSKKIESIILNQPILFTEALLETNHQWEFDKKDDLTAIMETSNPICICGAGYCGKQTYLLLKKFGLDCRVAFFIDNDPEKQGKQLYGREIKSFLDIDINILSDILFLIATNSRNAGEIYAQLMNVYTIPLSHIICPRSGHIRAWTGQQYFDVFAPNSHEIFVDAGASYGSTSVAFVNWTNDDYDGIYAFDPRINADKYYSEMLTRYNLKNAQFFSKGLWSSNTTLQFIENASGSCIADTGNNKVQVVSLDDILSNNRVSFIKMDIEGSELEALKGSKHIIMQYHPRLAISIYHKPEDIVSIPSYILHLYNHYRFIIRVYSSDGLETVLYAIPNAD